jgi:hypothetical protein
VIATIYDLGRVHYPWRWALRCDYNAELIADLKKYIHYRQRKWVPEKLQWWFHDDVIEAVVDIVEHYFGRVHHAEGEQKRQTEPEESALPPGRAAAYRALYLTPDAPADRVKAAYRTLCKIHHPDAGGSNGAMQKLNAAYERIKPK